MGGYDRFGAERLGLSEEEGKRNCKSMEKEANSKIVEFWYALKDGALDAMRYN